MIEEKKISGLNGNQLKMIAIIAMTIDHLAWVLFPGFDTRWYVLLMHIIGRLTAPVMWFFIAEGYHYTHDVKKYMMRLFLFVFISHFAYDFAFGIPMIPFTTGFINQTSVMWSLALAVVLIIIRENENISKGLKRLSVIGIGLLAFPSDWSIIAAMVPGSLLRHRGDLKKQAVDIVMWTAIYAIVYFFCLDKTYGIIQMFTFLAVPFLKMYNGQKGNWKGMKWFFYLYYPAHLLIIGILRICLHGNIALIQ